VATAIRTAVERFATGVASGGSVLDVGCGLRPYEDCFSHCTYLGMDVEESGRRASDKRPDVYFNGLDIPGDAERFDAAICTEVLEHCIDPVRLLSEINRVLKPGGQLLITVPFIWGEHEAPFDFRRYSHFGIEREVRRAGFQVSQLAKLVQGIDAVAMLVASEINNYDLNVLDPPTTRFARLRRRFWRARSERAWATQLKLWRRLYEFERIYIDNLVIGVKDRGTDGVHP
jgi:SAM-dependent methyltransferase